MLTNTLWLPNTSPALLTTLSTARTETFTAQVPNNFIGDPTSVYGYVCGTTPIVTAANNYFKYTGSKLKAIDITGSTPQELYELVDKGYPIVVWVTIGMVERSDIESWTGTDGKQYDWCMDDHAADLIGYSADTVTIADPINGLVEYPKENFESVFTSRNNKCVVLKNG